MPGEIIRKGDPTSHGGHVLEGSVMDICHGKPIAYIGHQTYCPECKGTFPIIEGALVMTFYGRGVALSGMKTACGATLIPTQFLDTVAYGNGNVTNRTRSTVEEVAEESHCSPYFHDSSTFSSSLLTAPSSSAYNVVFKAIDTSGNSASNTKYKITLEDGSVYLGVTDADGLTEAITSNRLQSANIEVPYYDISDDDILQHDFSCNC